MTFSLLNSAMPAQLPAVFSNATQGTGIGFRRNQEGLRVVRSRVAEAQQGDAPSEGDNER